MFPIILGVTVAFMSVALVFGIFLGIKVYKMQTIDSSVTVSVPNLTGREYSQKLLNELSETNFRISSVDFIYSDQFAADTIVEQTPAQGERKKLSSENAICNLSIIVSLGKEALIMPDYSIEEYRKSILEMRAMGLNPVVENVNHDAVMEGYIINTVPAAGDRINVGDTVKVYVSSGQKIKYSLMCDVIGETLENAKKILVENNFIVGTITRQPSDAPVGTVISQSVIPFKSVPEKYTIVDLVISINDNDTN